LDLEFSLTDTHTHTYAHTHAHTHTNDGSILIRTKRPQQTTYKRLVVAAQSKIREDTERYEKLN